VFQGKTQMPSRELQIRREHTGPAERPRASRSIAEHRAAPRACEGQLQRVVRPHANRLEVALSVMWRRMCVGCYTSGRSKSRGAISVDTKSRIRFSASLT
jgi:transcription elongation GreA/GreB family factor